MSAMTAEVANLEGIWRSPDSDPGPPRHGQGRTSVPPRQQPGSRPARRAGRSVSPQSRPVKLVPPPVPAAARPVISPTIRSCTVAEGTRWRLTDRGIAVIMVVGAMIIAAAVMVVAMTAVRVTSDTYQPSGLAEVSQH